MHQTTRDITLDDMHELALLYVETYEHFDVGEKWDLESAKSMLTWNYKRNPDLAICAEEKGKIIGAFMVAVKPWWDGNHLVDGEIFVSPRHQKRGIGTLLTKALFKRAKEKYQAVGWDTYTFRLSTHPLKWYKSLGFHEIHEWTMISCDLDEVLNTIQTTFDKSNT